MRREAYEEAGATLTRLTRVAQYIITTTPDLESASASTSMHVKTVYAVLVTMQHNMPICVFFPATHSSALAIDAYTRTHTLTLYTYTQRRRRWAPPLLLSALH
jgi:hypothetical protein